MPTPSDIIIHDCVIFNAFAGNHHEGDSIQRHQILQGCTESFKQEIVLYAWVLLTKALHILPPGVCDLSQDSLFFHGCSDETSQIHTPLPTFLSLFGHTIIPFLRMNRLQMRYIFYSALAPPPDMFTGINYQCQFFLMITSLTVSNAACWESHDVHVCSFLVNSWSGLIMEVRWETNLPT